MKSKRRSCRALSRYQREVLPIVTTGNAPEVLLWLWCLPPPSPPASPLSPSARGDRPQAWATQVHSSAPLLSTAPLCKDLTTLQRNPSCGELRLTLGGLWAAVLLTHRPNQLQEDKAYSAESLPTSSKSNKMITQILDTYKCILRYLLYSVVRAGLNLDSRKIISIVPFLCVFVCFQGYTLSRNDRARHADKDWKYT